MCGAPARWFTVHRAWAPDGSYGSHVAWVATCSVDSGHWELPGRPLTFEQWEEAEADRGPGDNVFKRGRRAWPTS